MATNRNARRALGMALLIMGAAAWNVSARADEPAKELTDAERDKLEKETTELSKQAFQLYQVKQYVAATNLLEKVIVTRRKLYPADKYPDGHPNLARSLNNLGFVLKQQGEYDKAEPFLCNALSMYRRLYPPEKLPDGHPELAGCLNNLGELLDDRGDYGKAEPYYREALEMRKRLFTPAKYPDGHSGLAGCLNNLGHVLQAQGKYGEAEPYDREAVEMYKRLYPPEKFPDGHPELATSLNNLGGLRQAQGEYGKAEQFMREALAMRKRLYLPEKYSDGHPDLAMSLDNLGVLLTERSQYGKAEPLLRDALDMRKRLYPPAKFPGGHRDLSSSLTNIAFLLQARGDYGKAESYCQEALEMDKRQYPPKKYPGGHPNLARSLNNLAVLQKERGEYGKSETHLREALDMDKHLYPSEKYPDGHADISSILENLGNLLLEQGEYDKAELFLRDALDMNKRLYPPEKYADGHPRLAASLHNMGTLLDKRGDYGRAEPFYRDAVNMKKRLYPPDKYPDGHAELAASLNNLGTLLRERGEYGKAADFLAEGASMYDRLTTIFADSGAEAEVLNLAASMPGARNLFLAVTRNAEGAQRAEQYSVLWQGKSALARGLQRRRRLLHAAADADEATRRKVQTLIGVRQDVARLVLAPARPGDADRARLVQDLTEKKERLEKELAALLPASGRSTLSYPDLADRLPERTAFIDLYRYVDWDPKTRKGDNGHYAAFVLRKDRPIRRVELADAAAIDKDLTEWRSDIVKDLRSDAAGRLRKAVWQPIAAVLGEGVDTVYICPDGPLSALPWSALPGERPRSVLLEDYAFAVVPGGPSLLDQLTESVPVRRGPGVLLAVGGVRYDRGDKLGKPWPSLPATDKERAAVVAEAGKLSHPPQIVERSGAGADVPRLLADLPKARWAHLATHGFFAAPNSKEREHLFRPDAFLMGVGSERRGAAARNPLTLSGVVLAGANQPTDADTGILTGEAVAGLNLDGMDLVVLSACQTGLGEAAAGEGVFGLQRAFHIGGARNVVASLWKVNDEATAALMNRFYYHLWEKNESPLQALRHAQLELYRHPQTMPALAKRSGIDFDETVRQATKATTDAKETAAVKDWAAFVLSGAGR